MSGRNLIHTEIWYFGNTNAFSKDIFQLIKPIPNNVFNCDNSGGAKLRTHSSWFKSSTQEPARHWTVEKNLQNISVLRKEAAT